MELISKALPQHKKKFTFSPTVRNKLSLTKPNALNTEMEVKNL
jgi:hypothetical protein